MTPLTPVCPSQRWVSSWSSVKDHAGLASWSLMMMNGPLMRRATRLEEGSLLHRVVQSDMSPPDKIEHLFLAALSRPPTLRETRAAEALLRGRNGDVGAALQDIWWALLNSNEFILDH